MRTNTMEKVVANSLIYGYAVTQPFALHVDAQPLLQDKLLAEAETIQYGENSKIVRHLQYKLSKLGYYEDAIDGVFGLLTENAVKGFQSSHEIKVTGKADKETMLTMIYREKKAEISQIKNIIQSIQYGENSNDVRKVQEVLFYHGYYKGSIDGIYGPMTDKAIRQIEQDHLIEKTNTASDTIETFKQKAEQRPEQVKEDAVVQLKVEGNVNSIISKAKTYIGTPYVWGGTSPSGFDCSGFIQFVYGENEKLIPRTVSEIWNFSRPIDSPSVGDLVFFETYQAGPSHLGIYLGNGDFIHAGSSRGVEISNYKNNSYWSERYLGAKRID